MISRCCEWTQTGTSGSHEWSREESQETRRCSIPLPELLGKTIIRAMVTRHQMLRLLGQWAAVDMLQGLQHRF